LARCRRGCAAPRPGTPGSKPPIVSLCDSGPGPLPGGRVVEPEALVKHYLLFYDIGEDYVQRRAAFRAAHLEKAWRAHERAELVLGGPLANPVDGAVLLFKGESPEVAEAFAKEDPYVVNGLVLRWRVREWTTVAGEGAASPVRP
jgi:uncharacterized protein YciI